MLSQSIRSLFRNPHPIARMKTKASKHLKHLADLWHREQRAVDERFVAERRELTLSERIDRGYALRDLAIEDTDAAPGNRTLLWLSVRNTTNAVEELRISNGDPVRLWTEDPDDPDAIPGTVARIRADRIAVMIDGDIPEHLETEGFRLDRDAPKATFERGLRAIERFRKAEPKSDNYRLRETLFGNRAPEFNPEPEPWTPFDSELNQHQIDAVGQALAAQDVALIHGPPGTGKTRTLVEVVRQAVARGERVLVSAASNTAVDNLAERLAELKVDVVRVGHPARVSPAMESRTLDALLEKTDAYKLAREWSSQATALRRRARNRLARGALLWRDHKEMLREAGRLQRDARNHMRQAQFQIVDHAAVLCSTAAGADSMLLGKARFDCVVIDEATQATDPIVLIPLSRAPRVILAGDPCQLPPTVIDPSVARDGLATSLFERLADTKTPELLRLLLVQHRMHRSLMAFPSASMYAGKLVAAPHVAEHTLDDLGIAPDPLRPTPLVLIDTAGTGWEEILSTDDPSTSNPDLAARTAREAIRLIGRGIAPADMAIITPYYAQVRVLRELLADYTEKGLDIGTIDGFQGREKEAIVLDLVRSNPDSHIGFLSDTRRMNVAITRARRSLLILADTATIGAHKYYVKLLEAVEQHGTWISAYADDAPPFDA